ncbi:50S ribosomal protein L32 [Lentilactobacillus senioris]|uniref:50S ribosomal protein L32 n=1 Tax=Lentilactobacillus senioris TaxID=931534 RepID=UPI00227DE6A8|nr:50S ribosomal protein L32 [Lentilactobacillus senioris]MCY9806062.1 50S ribosomal protein L32 [Lentilactobacillus senioris]
MAVPARRTSKTKKNNRRANQKLKQPNLSRDPQTGEYHLSHHVSADGYYNGKKVIN